MLSNPGVWRPSVDGMPFKALERQEVDGFEVSFSKEEVFCAFLELNRDKAPSFDRFSLAFWKFCWYLMKEEVLGLFREIGEKFECHFFCVNS